MQMAFFLLSCICALFYSVFSAFYIGISIIKRRRQGDNKTTETAKNSKCDTHEHFYAPISSKEKEVLGKIRKWTDELIATLADEMDPQAARITSRYKKSNLTNQIDSEVLGKYVNGCAYYNVQREEHIYKDSRLKAVICHELAHACGKGHDEEWLRANAYVLRIATEKLGWDVLLMCRACTKYGLCEKSQCPECRWESENCKR